MQTENKKPLYKVLNEQRTQVKWFVSNTKMTSGSLITIDPNISVMKDTDEMASVNAQYTALAVNNLHILAEALDEIKQKVLFMEREEDLDEAVKATLLNEMFYTCREALNKIS